MYEGRELRIVAYERVSTARQGRSGLGIKARRSAVTRFAEAEGIAPALMASDLMKAS